MHWACAPSLALQKEINTKQDKKKKHCLYCCVKQSLEYNHNEHFTICTANLYVWVFINKTSLTDDLGGHVSKCSLTHYRNTSPRSAEPS